MASIGAIILAAGQSRRCGPNKLLAEIAGKPVIAHVVEAVVGAGLAPVVVVGHQAEAVQRVLPGVEVVFNPDYAKGFASSLRVGLVTVTARRPSGYLLCLGDLPLLRARHCIHVIEAYDRRKICIPTFQGQLGHPRLFPPDCLDALMAATGDQGPRHLLETERYRIQRLPMDEAVVTDVDTASALEHLQRTR